MFLKSRLPRDDPVRLEGFRSNIAPEQYCSKAITSGHRYDCVKNPLTKLGRLRQPTHPLPLFLADLNFPHRLLESLERADTAVGPGKVFALRGAGGESHGPTVIAESDKMRRFGKEARGGRFEQFCGSNWSIDKSQSERKYARNLPMQT